MKNIRTSNKPFEFPVLDLRKHFLREDRLEIPSDIRNIILYHGTTSRFRDEILADGLTPRKDNQNSVYLGSLASQENLVYLAREEVARHLGRRAIEKYGGDIMVVRVDVDVANLVEDEDARNRFWAMNWRESLESEGTCAHRGIIKPVNEVVIYQESHKNKTKIIEKCH